MSLYEDNNLPGVFTEVVAQVGEDYDTSQFGTGDSVCIIGTAFNGPTGKVVKVYSPAHGKYIFGGSFNPSDRKEATLTAGIQDAWDRGCRTIYAVRIGGKEIYKDYQLAVDSSFKLRVSGLFPSNANKQLALAFVNGENGDDEGSIKIFKNSDRATVKEKKYGFVESASQILVNDIQLSAKGLDMNSELVDLIKAVNEHQFNNVLKLSIVDEEGNDVTLSSREAKALKVSDMFKGIYLIGRGPNKKGFVDTEVILDTDKEGKLVKKIVKNTNSSKDYPLFSIAKDLDKLLDVPSLKEYGFLTVQGRIDELFEDDGVDYEEVDMSLYEAYEKLGSGFAINAEINFRESTSRSALKPKVVEVTDKSRRISAIKGGLYSMLENLEVDYRVLLGFNADDKIKGRLPKPKDFKISKPNEVEVVANTMKIVPIVNKEDFTAAKHYKVSIVGNSEIPSIRNSEVEIGKVVREASIITKASIDALNSTDALDRKTAKEGSLFLVPFSSGQGPVVPPGPGEGEGSGEGSGEEQLPAKSKKKKSAPVAPEQFELFIYTNGKLVSMHKTVSSSLSVDANPIFGELIYSGGKLYKATAPVYKNGELKVLFAPVINLTDAVTAGKNYITVSMDKDIFSVVKVSEATQGGDPLACEVIGTCEQVFRDDEDILYTSISTEYSDSEIAFGNSSTFNEIKIVTNQYDYMTIEELAKSLNDDKDFAKLFKAEILNETEAQSYVEDILGADLVLECAGAADRETGYDASKLIRFRTTDNFARQLAQHCAYTSLKTIPTHGIIGVSPLLNTSLESVDRKVQALMDLQLESTLVAKKENGQDMLNKDSIPTHVGSNISVTVCQYPVVTAENYTYISNLAAGYAGMVSKLPIDQSSTNQPISIPRPTIMFNQYHLKNLTNSGFVTVKDSEVKGLAITDGVTMAPISDVFRRLANRRVMNAIDNILRVVCEPYIGKQNSIANQNSLRTDIKSRLEAVKDKLIEGYEFRMDIDSSTKQLGKINIFYRIVPIYEIKEIKNNITI